VKVEIMEAKNWKELQQIVKEHIRKKSSDSCDSCIGLGNI
jgi:hypothetical protein